MSKQKTRAEEIARDTGIKDGRKGNDECPYMTAQYAQCWREGHAQGKAEMKETKEEAVTEWNIMQRRGKQKTGKNETR